MKIAMKVVAASLSLTATIGVHAAVAEPANDPAYPHQTVQHVGDGIVCLVNGPPSTAAKNLSMRERVRAEVAATAYLRRQPGNMNHYPTPATAPTVTCEKTTS